MKKKVITISREYGSGGHNIAKELAKKLGYTYYDKKLIEQVAENTLLPEEYIKEYGEYEAKPNIFSNFFMSKTSKDGQLYDYLFREQKKVIEDIANKGNCVIVGRSADFYLKDRDDTLNVFIFADKPFCVGRTMMKENLTLEEARKRIDEMNEKRRLNYKRCTKQEWGAKENYDVLLNSSHLGIDGCVEFLEKLLQE
ncbi:MAG: cytidylate kinase-like family protein [Bacillota bacterium]|nr:cytidylate kinase-like family protein [Bacillota bacterium]